MSSFSLTSPSKHTCQTNTLFFFVTRSEFCLYSTWHRSSISSVVDASLSMGTSFGVVVVVVMVGFFWWTRCPFWWSDVNWPDKIPREKIGWNQPANQKKCLLILVQSTYSVTETTSKQSSDWNSLFLREILSTNLEPFFIRTTDRRSKNKLRPDR